YSPEVRESVSARACGVPAVSAPSRTVTSRLCPAWTPFNWPDSSEIPPLRIPSTSMLSHPSPTAAWASGPTAPRDLPRSCSCRERLSPRITPAAEKPCVLCSLLPCGSAPSPAPAVLSWSVALPPPVVPPSPEEPADPWLESVCGELSDCGELCDCVPLSGWPSWLPGVHPLRTSTAAMPRAVAVRALCAHHCGWRCAHDRANRRGDRANCCSRGKALSTGADGSAAPQRPWPVLILILARSG